MLRLSPSHPSSLLRRLPALAVLAFLLLASAPLHAHHLPPGMEDVDEFDVGAAFLAGARHPLLGMEHWFFAITAGALLAAASRKRAGRLASVLLAGLAVGGWAGLQDVVFPGASAAAWLAFAGPLLWLAAGHRYYHVCLLAWLGLAALLQGNGHGLAWPLEAAGLPYMAGVLLTTAILAFAGWAVALCAHSLRRPSTVASH